MRGFHTLIKNISFSFPTDVESTPIQRVHQGLASLLTYVPFSNRCGTSNPPPFGTQDSASSLAHYLVSGFDSDIICNSPSSSLADIVLFGLSLSSFPSRFLKMHRRLERGFHTLTKNASFSSPTDVESHNPPPFRTHHPRDVRPPIHLLHDSASSLTHHPNSDIICNSPSSLLIKIVFFELVRWNSY